MVGLPAHLASAAAAGVRLCWEAVARVVRALPCRAARALRVARLPGLAVAVVVAVPAARAVRVQLVRQPVLSSFGLGTWARFNFFRRWLWLGMH